MFDEFFKQEKIEYLKQELKKVFEKQTISAIQLFNRHHPSSMYAAQHYRIALRQLADENEIDVFYIDGKNHKVSVLLSESCILSFK